MNGSAYLDPASAMDNPLLDFGLNGNPDDPSDVRRMYYYPGLNPSNATVQATGAKRYLPLVHDEDYLIVQNIEALKCIILSIERYENNAPDEAQRYRQSGMELLQAEVKKHIFDPRNYMARKSNYSQDVVNFSQDTFGWMRAQLALDMIEALRMSKNDLTWTINQAERRLMERGIWKGTIVTIQGQVVGGILYMPRNVESVLALDLCGKPIPIRSQFFQSLENGPGGFPASNMLIDQGDKLQPGFFVSAQGLQADCRLRQQHHLHRRLQTALDAEGTRGYDGDQELRGHQADGVSQNEGRKSADSPACAGGSAGCRGHSGRGTQELPLRHQAHGSHSVLRVRAGRCRRQQLRK